MRRHVLLAAVLLLHALAAAAEPVEPRAVGVEPKLKPITATYDVYWHGLSFGQADITLAPDPSAPDCYSYRSATHPIGFVRLLYGEPHQESLFCVRNSIVVARQMRNVSPKRAGDSYTMTFVWGAEGGTVTDGIGPPRAVPAGAVDVFTLIHAVRLWALTHATARQAPVGEFVVVDHKRTTNYKIRISGREPVDTALGHFNALVFERIDTPGKISKFWVLPERDYQVLKGIQRSGGGPQITLELVAAS